jgi:hypothetical protein
MKQRRSQRRENDWTSDIKSRSEKGKQIKCLTAHDGWMWMPTFDRLPAIVRKRLSESRFNICAECMAIEAEEIARKRRMKPSVAICLETIGRIEREMESTESARGDDRE